MPLHRAPKTTCHRCSDRSSSSWISRRRVPGFSAALGDAALAALTDALGQRGLGLESVAKLSCYAPVEETAFWQELAIHRGAWFEAGLPAVSDVVSSPRGGKPRLQLDATCVTGDSETLPIRPLGERTERGHPEAVTVGPLLFTSALFAPAGMAGPPSSVTAEVTAIMNRHAVLLRSAGLSFADVIKANTFYEGAGSAEALHENMQARNVFYREPGPRLDRPAGIRLSLCRQADLRRVDGGKA